MAGESQTGGLPQDLPVLDRVGMVIGADEVGLLHSEVLTNLGISAELLAEYGLTYLGDDEGEGLVRRGLSVTDQARYDRTVEELEQSRRARNREVAQVDLWRDFVVTVRGLDEQGVSKIVGGMEEYASDSIDNAERHAEFITLAVAFARGESKKHNVQDGVDG